MSEALFPFYERELLYQRQLLQEFARKYPTVGQRLLLETNRSADPHTERLIQNFAFLAGRVQQRLSDDYPEISDSMCNLLYPHFTAPFPSLTTLQFEPDPLKAPMAQGFVIPRGSKLSTRHEGRRGRYRTCYDATLWPIRVTGASFLPPPFPQGLTPPPGAAALIRIQLECLGQLPFAKLEIPRLRFYLHGDSAVASLLYETIFQHGIQTIFRPLEAGSSSPALTSAAASLIHAVGFGRDEGLIPYGPRSPLGYRLLTEYAHYPEKFFYFDLGGWRQVARAKFDKTCEINLFVSRTAKLLEQNVSATTFRLGCVPIVNLFEHDAEPIPLEGRAEYRIDPSKDESLDHEIYAVEKVTLVETKTELAPFNSIRHDAAPDASLWTSTRRLAEKKGDQGTEVFLHLVDLAFTPFEPEAGQLQVQTTCSNRDLPVLLQRDGDKVRFELEMAAPYAKVNCLHAVTSPDRPSLGRGLAWRLISHFNPNHLSLTSEAESLEGLREILSLYPLPEAHIEGVAGLTSRRVLGRVQDGLGTGLCQGVEVTLTLDREKFAPASIFLFACVLEQFLGLYASANSFTQLVLRRLGDAQEYRRWPPRPGEGAIL